MDGGGSGVVTPTSLESWEPLFRRRVSSAQREGWWLRLRKEAVEALLLAEHEHLLGALAGPAIRRLNKASRLGRGMHLTVGEVQALELPTEPGRGS